MHVTSYFCSPVKVGVGYKCKYISILLFWGEKSERWLHPHYARTCVSVVHGQGQISVNTDLPDSPPPPHTIVTFNLHCDSVCVCMCVCLERERFLFKLLHFSSRAMQDSLGWLAPQVRWVRKVTRGFQGTREHQALRAILWVDGNSVKKRVGVQRTRMWKGALCSLAGKSPQNTHCWHSAFFPIGHHWTSRPSRPTWITWPLSKCFPCSILDAR